MAVSTGGGRFSCGHKDEQAWWPFWCFFSEQPNKKWSEKCEKKKLILITSFSLWWFMSGKKVEKGNVVKGFLFCAPLLGSKAWKDICSRLVEREFKKKGGKSEDAFEEGFLTRERSSKMSFDWILQGTRKNLVFHLSRMLSQVLLGKFQGVYSHLTYALRPTIKLESLTVTKGWVSHETAH